MGRRRIERPSFSSHVTVLLFKVTLSIFLIKMIRKIFPRRPRLPDFLEEEVEDVGSGEGFFKLWTLLRHNGPYFDSIDEEMEQREMISIYQRIPSSYRNKTFWSNCPFPRRELERTLSKNPPKELPEGVRELHSTCLVDGREESIATWKMEPPSVFLGRGDHPLRGRFRRRVIPEDVILNLDEGAPVPKLPPGRKWGGVVHQHSSPWLWSWLDPLLEKWKYVYPNPASEQHMIREKEKFDVARSLKEVIKDIRVEYLKVLRNPDEDLKNVELAMILLLIDRLGIRIGNSGSQTGATTLMKSNVVIFPEKRMMKVRFVGKDSIVFDRDIHVEDFVTSWFFTLMSTPGPYLFPQTTSRDVNQYLGSIDPKLKAKVFRTYNASEIFQRGLMKGEPSISRFKAAGVEVAVFCNHRKIGILTRAMDQYSPNTSITNYIDPRIGVAWAKRNSIPLSKLYSRGLLKRFEWALNTPEHFLW